MNSTFKIILALKLKILLIVLSIGGSFFIEGKLAKERAIENIKEIVQFERIDQSEDIPVTEDIEILKTSYVAEKNSYTEPDSGRTCIINNLIIEIEL
jgi:hypothetical protein